MCKWRDFKSSFNKCLSLALREINSGTNSPAHNCATEVTVKGFRIIRLNPNNQQPNKTNALSYFQGDKMSDHAEAWSRTLFSLSLPSALMPTYLYSSKLKKKRKEKIFPLALVFSGLSPSCSSVKKRIPKTGCNSLLSIKIILSFQSWSPYFPHLSSTLQNIRSFLCIVLDYFTNTANQRKHTSE